MSGTTPGSAPALPDLRPRRRATGHWPVRRWMASVSVLGTVILLVAVLSGAIALTRLTNARGQLIDDLDPALLQSQALTTALLDQEAGLRGYALTGRGDFLGPYQQGVRDENSAISTLRGLADGVGDDRLRADLGQVLDRAEAWRRDYADPLIAGVGATHTPLTDSALEQGKARFDAVRAAADVLRDHLDTDRAAARAAVQRAADLLEEVFIAVSVVLLVLVAALVAAFQLAVARPVVALADEVRAVTEGDLYRRIRGTGPSEVVGLAEDIEAMRQRITDEVTELHRAHELLDARTQELQRSNSDLEQFAYVASHDLQEPLRKIASFCQLLQRRYGGQLDERADQYIGFAVDGAKRMQVLINDLLAFSRVGRRSGEHTEVSTEDLLDRALSNLAAAVEETGARITHDPLPVVLGESSLLTAVFQNLVSNALKFRGEDPPEIHIGVRRTGDEWLFSVRDNGIGIEPEYADRIFVIFQRLHAKEAYPGTGIGLAMCRKIVEYHGGRIWLDTTEPGGRTTFSFTLPALPDPEPEPAAADLDSTTEPTATEPTPTERTATAPTATPPTATEPSGTDEDQA